MPRSRGRTRRQHQNNARARHHESNADGIKIRGSAAQILEKYQQLARDASSASDHINAQNYLQYAEHYGRLVAAQKLETQTQSPHQTDTDKAPPNSLQANKNQAYSNQAHNNQAHNDQAHNKAHNNQTHKAQAHKNQTDKTPDKTHPNPSPAGNDQANKPKANNGARLSERTDNMDSQTDNQIDNQTDSQTDNQADGQTDNQANN